MTPAPQGREWFTVPEAAKILGVHVQTLYDAVNDGRMAAQGQGRDRRIGAQAILDYAVRTRKDVQSVVEQMKETRSGINWEAVFVGLLTALGLYALYKGSKDD